MSDKETIRRLRSEMRDYDHVFDLMRRANLRGCKMWQNKTGNRRVLPDQATLVVFLLAEIESLKKELRK